jgi:hypothetical protein
VAKHYQFATSIDPGIAPAAFDSSAFVASLRAKDFMRARDHVRGMLSEAGIVDGDVAKATTHSELAAARTVEIREHLPGMAGYRDWDGKVVLSTRTAELLKGFVDGERTWAAWAGVRTLIHEQLHGASPLMSGAYRETGALVEEVTTETLARKFLREHFVDAPRWSMDQRGMVNYDDWHDAMRAEMQKIAPKAVPFVLVTSGAWLQHVTSDAWIGALERASLAFKQLAPRSLPSPQEVTRHFATLLVAELGEGSVDDCVLALDAAAHRLRKEGYQL